MSSQSPIPPLLFTMEEQTDDKDDHFIPFLRDLKEIDKGRKKGVKS